MNKNLPNKPIPSEYLESPAMHDASHIRDAKCVPIAFELIRMIANMQSFPVGMHSNDKELKESPFLPVMRDFMKILIEKEVKVSEVTYIFALVYQGIEAVKDVIDESLNQNMNRITELVYGLELNKYNEVSVKNLNDVVENRDKIKEIWDSILKGKE